MPVTGSSVYYRILEGVRDVLLSITGELPLMQDTEVRIVGKYFESPIDYLPVIVVSYDDPDNTDWASFEGHRYKEFTVYVAVLAANNQDYDSKFDTYLLWRERIENKLDPLTEPILANVPDSIVQVQVLPQTILDSRLAGRGYAYTGMAVKYTVVIERAA